MADGPVTVRRAYELRRWYGHDPDRPPRFRERYEEESEASERVECLVRLLSPGG